MGNRTEIVMNAQDKDPLMDLLRRAATGDTTAGTEFDQRRAARIWGCARAEDNAHKAALRLIQQRTTA
ncbi:hypothetical protein ACH4U6_35585 [Streptomyces netropsis]|uniref:hypothetical protein n=1 Tax=Streptomyces netropsis TaxID=55404 RepID=UPI00378F19FA